MLAVWKTLHFLFKVLLNLLKMKAWLVQGRSAGGSAGGSAEGRLAHPLGANFMSALRPLGRSIINIKDTCPDTAARTVVAKQ